MKDFYFFNGFHWGDLYLDSKRIENFASQYNGNVYYIIKIHTNTMQKLFHKVKV
jgi:hypothetical protein